jgi:ATP-dependent Clp protease ATP-binding subunit ClpA
MVEPSDNLQAVFERAIDTAKKLHHEYLTIEHLLFAMLAEESFSNVVQGYGANLDAFKKNLNDYLQNKCAEITIQDVVVKPKKTQSVERVLNRAFTQVLFNGRQRIEPTDVFLAMMGEKRSWAFFYIMQAEIDKDKFADFINNLTDGLIVVLTTNGPALQNLSTRVLDSLASLGCDTTLAAPSALLHKQEFRVSML